MTSAPALTADLSETLAALVEGTLSDEHFAQLQRSLRLCWCLSYRDSIFS